MKNSIKAIKNDRHLFTISNNNCRSPSTDKDLDCWSDLWQRIKAQWSRVIKPKK